MSSPYMKMGTLYQIDQLSCMFKDLYLLFLLDEQLLYWLRQINTFVNYTQITLICLPKHSKCKLFLSDIFVYKLNKFLYSSKRGSSELQK